MIDVRDFIIRLCDRIFAAHEVIGRKAERREFTLTEYDYCPQTGDKPSLPHGAQ